MWENPKRTEAVHQPTISLLDARDNTFWSKPRNRNSSGHAVKKRMASAVNRSEEHTSELQSPDHLVCRLLLEKKKQQQTHSLLRATEETRKIKTIMQTV